MSEGLQSLMSDISQMKTLPDADLEFLVELETFILNKLREPIDATMGQVPGSPPGAGNPQGGIGPLPGVPSAPGGGVPNLRTEPAAPNPDELRRLVGG